MVLHSPEPHLLLPATPGGALYWWAHRDTTRVKADFGRWGNGCMTHLIIFLLQSLLMGYAVLWISLASSWVQTTPPPLYPHKGLILCRWRSEYPPLTGRTSAGAESFLYGCAHGCHKMALLLTINGFVLVWVSLGIVKKKTTTS